MTSLTRKKKPNRLMLGLIVISLSMHLLFLMHVAGIYRSNALTYIEFTMEDVAKPVGRSIPRPRVRHKAPKRTDVKNIHIQKQQIPRIKIEQVDNTLPDTIMQDISVPDIPDSLGPNIANWDTGTNAESVTANDYFDMVRLKIESRKKYPDIARSRRIEGRVTIKFVIATDGQVTSVMIVKRGRHSSLNTAALKAVQDAAPFPRPPSNLFKEPLYMEITIVFELT